MFFKHNLAHDRCSARLITLAIHTLETQLLNEGYSEDIGQLLYTATFTVIHPDKGIDWDILNCLIRVLKGVRTERLHCVEYREMHRASFENISALVPSVAEELSHIIEALS